MSLKPTLPESQKVRLRAHFGFTRTPFCKNLWVSELFDSRSQREAHHALNMWSELHGFAVVTGPAGVGKSVTLRRFVQGLDDAKFSPVLISSVPSTLHGFLRVINRALGLPMRLHVVDLFDQAQRHLMAPAAEPVVHPVLVLDDAEGTSVENLDVLRRLTAHALDAEDRFSVLLSGTDDLLGVLRDPRLEPLRSRIGYAQALRGYTVEDTRNYVAFHLQRAGISEGVFTDEAVKRLFQATKGLPRSINQLALQAMIQAAVVGRDAIDGTFLSTVIAAHPLFDAKEAS